MPDLYLAHFVDNSFKYVMNRKETYILRELQNCLNSMVLWCECQNITSDEDKDTGHVFVSYM
jgi:hypothetical protein